MSLKEMTLGQAHDDAYPEQGHGQYDRGIGKQLPGAKQLCHHRSRLEQPARDDEAL